MVDKENPNVDNYPVDKTPTPTQMSDRPQPSSNPLLDQLLDQPANQQPDTTNWTSNWNAGQTPDSGVRPAVSVTTTLVEGRQPSGYIRDKERRLRQQNLELLRPLKRLPKVAFGSNRFGPLMFLLAFGIVGMYFGVMSFASPVDSAGRAVNLSVEPSQRRLVAGETITVRVWEDSLSVPVNAVKAQLTYDKDAFDFVAIDSTVSSFSSDDSSTPTDGGVLLSRRASTGLIGRQLVASVVLRAKAETGNTSITFDGDSKLIHATDQTNVLQKTFDGTYFVSDSSSN